MAFVAYLEPEPDPTFSNQSVFWFAGRCFLRTVGGSEVHERTIVAASERLNVIPASIHRNRAIDVQIATPTVQWNLPALWHGMTYKVGRVDLWLLQSDRQMANGRSFSVPVILPDGDPEDVLPYVYLGGWFLSHYGARMSLDFALDPSANRPPRGQLIFP